MITLQRSRKTILPLLVAVLGSGLSISSFAYKTQPVSLPGTIEAENYDIGGYYDSDRGNNGNAYRGDDVDIEPSTRNGYNVGWTEVGEWLEYQVTVPKRARYQLASLVASESSGGAFKVSVDGAELIRQEVPSTGGWQGWQWVRSNLTLPAGQHTLRVTTTRAGYNLNALKFRLLETNDTVCTAVAITPYLRVNNGNWQQTANATLNVGDSVTFGPQPTGGGWSWSGCGTSGAAREQTVSPSSSCQATATYTNSCGLQTQQSYKLTVDKGANTGGGNGATGGTWNKANLTWYTSYPDPGSEECVAYNGCTWAGQFAFVDGKKSESWVKDHNIAAVHEKDAGKYANKTLRLRQNGQTIDVVVYDMCSDSDCDNCCTQNARQNGLNFLIDIESYTKGRFGSGEGVVEWQCLDCK